MKQVFVTPPTTQMILSECGNHNFYCLGQIYKKNNEYREYALKAKRDGRFIILDSGVGDHGQPLTNRELFEVACELHPNEIIPLDTLYYAQGTINNVIEMYEWLKEAGLENVIDIFMCPQGDTYEEWLECYNWALKDERVKTIGWSKKTIPHIIFPGCQADEYIGESRNILYDILKTWNLIQKPIHLLGSGGPQEYVHYKDEPLMRSTDSCVAVWEGMNKNFFDSPNYKRIPTPPDYFERELTKEQIADVLKNIALFYQIINPLPTH